LDWRRQQLGLGGQAADLDWLLDLQAGVGWQALQQLRLWPERPLELRCSLGELESLWSRHLAHHQPLQYLVGRCPWRDLELAVAPGVLIPRQETELLVDLALDRASLLGRPPRCWADLGTGSGCLAIALARAWPASQGLAVDASAEALHQAASNRDHYGLEGHLQLLHGSWWEPLAPWWGQLELVVSNPPYIPQAVWEQLEPIVRDHEPPGALSAGSDGLADLRQISRGALAALKPGGWLLLEHHHDQSSAVLELLQAAGLEQLEAHCDLEGRQRFALARTPLQP
jgi:release factor glutamine methyltransferase